MCRSTSPGMTIWPDASYTRSAPRGSSAGASAAMRWPASARSATPSTPEAGSITRPPVINQSYRAPATSRLPRPGGLRQEMGEVLFQRRAQPADPLRRHGPGRAARRARPEDADGVDGRLGERRVVEPFVIERQDRILEEAVAVLLERQRGREVAAADRAPPLHHERREGVDEAGHD